MEPSESSSKMNSLALGQGGSVEHPVVDPGPLSEAGSTPTASLMHRTSAVGSSGVASPKTPKSLTRFEDPVAIAPWLLHPHNSHDGPASPRGSGRLNAASLLDTPLGDSLQDLRQQSLSFSPGSSGNQSKARGMLLQQQLSGLHLSADRPRSNSGVKSTGPDSPVNLIASPPSKLNLSFTGARTRSQMGRPSVDRPEGDHIAAARDFAAIRVGPRSSGGGRASSQGQVVHFSGEWPAEAGGPPVGGGRLASITSRQRGLSRSGVFSCGGADVMGGGSQLQSQTHEALQQLGVVHLTASGDALHPHGSGGPLSQHNSKQPCS